MRATQPQFSISGEGKAAVVHCAALQVVLEPALFTYNGEMPLPSDERVVRLADEILQQFDTIFGLHPGFRPAHAKGLLLNGTFTPSAAARNLTRASHVTNPSTPVIARFSNSTGLPLIPDNDPNANPRGLAIRFQMAEHVHTDIVAHSTDGFPAHTGAEFLELLQAIAASASSTSHPLPIEQFLGAHPAALAFVQAPKPTPSSFAKEQYFAVTAFRFTNPNGVSRFGRYRIVPEAGVEHLSDDAAQKKDANFLFDELEQRVMKGPIGFRILVQLANEGDVVDDATIHWPEDRELVELGSFTLTGIAPENEPQQKQIIFDPIPRVDGIEPSGDPLLELRAAIYLLSGRRRRKAPETQAAAS
jgi:catalase